MRAPIEEYKAVEEAAMKLVRAVAEGNSTYARELFTDEAVLFGCLDGRLKHGSIEQFYHNVDTTPAGEHFKARVDVLLLEESLAVVRVLEEGWAAASTSRTCCSFSRWTASGNASPKRTIRIPTPSRAIEPKGKRTFCQEDAFFVCAEESRSGLRPLRPPPAGKAPFVGERVEGKLRHDRPHDPSGQHSGEPDARTERPWKYGGLPALRHSAKGPRRRLRRREDESFSPDEAPPHGTVEEARHDFRERRARGGHLRSHGGAPTVEPRFRRAVRGREGERQEPRLRRHHAEEMAAPCRGPAPREDRRRLRRCEQVHLETPGDLLRLLVAVSALRRRHARCEERPVHARSKAPPQSRPKRRPVRHVQRETHRLRPAGPQGLRERLEPRLVPPGEDQPRRSRLRQLPRQLSAEPAGRPKDQHPLSAIKHLHRRAPFPFHYTAARFLRRSCPVCPALSCAPAERARPVSPRSAHFQNVLTAPPARKGPPPFQSSTKDRPPLCQEDRSFLSLLFLMTGGADGSEFGHEVRRGLALPRPARRGGRCPLFRLFQVVVHVPL